MKNTSLQFSVFAILILAGACQKLEMITPQADMTSSEARANSVYCATIYITNKVTANIMKNGTSVTNTGTTKDVALVNPNFVYSIVNGENGQTVTQGENSVGSNLAFGTTGSIDVTYATRTIVPNVALFSGNIRTNSTSYNPGSYWEFPISYGNGNEGKCGYIYFYTLKNKAVGSLTALARSIASYDPSFFSVSVVSYNLAADLKRENPYYTQQNFKLRLQQIKTVIASVSNMEVSDLAKEANVYSVYQNKKNDDTWVQAIAKTVALKKMRDAGLPESQRLAEVVSQYVKSNQ